MEKYKKEALTHFKKNDKEKRTVITCRLPEELFKELTVLCETNQIVQSDFIRWALTQEIKRWNDGEEG